MGDIEFVDVVMCCKFEELFNFDDFNLVKDMEVCKWVYLFYI